ncbi:DUF3817 domain-containing protein [Aquiluna borgnonia]|uniref:DUF3817 domain-containing protein n=1 Tax=Aquiluna borgnonia TaxID=2499157 RepID=A0A7D4UHY2_9MICO|nr:DUF3817 domain-containing protein [Aquiluna borgnonia]QKJ24820.1 DUF3817 domain-containing protein [Aquiluna borgnonia]
MTGPAKSQITAASKAVKLFSVSSYITGIFLLLLMITWGIRRLPFLGYELWAMGPGGFITFEQYGLEGEGLPEVGFSLTTAILVVHGWLYVLYLFADFRVWTLMRWSFFRFLFIALGGVVPLLSFYTEARYAKMAKAEIAQAQERA